MTTRIIMIALLVLTLGFYGKSWAEKHDEKAHKHEDSKESHGEGEEHEHSAEEEGEEHEHGADEEGEEHDHGAEEKNEEHGKEAHGHGGEGGHEEEASAVGPDKGILEKGKNGFKLAPEAIASFGLKAAKIQGGVSSLPKSAIVKVKAKKYVYRVLDGWIKKIPLDKFKSGDEVVTEGNGYVRVAELVVEEGLAGHEH